MTVQHLVKSALSMPIVRRKVMMHLGTVVFLELWDGDDGVLPSRVERRLGRAE